MPIDQLVSDLSHPDWTVRQGAAVALGNLGDSKAVQPLITSLMDPKWDVAKAAATALEKLLPPEEAKKIIREIGDLNRAIVFLSDPGWMTRGRAAEALGDLKDIRALDPLVRVMKEDDNWSVRGSAARALGKLKDQRAIPHLVTALRDSDSDVRKHAAWALEDIGGPEAEQALRERGADDGSV